MQECLLSARSIARTYLREGAQFRAHANEIAATQYQAAADLGTYQRSRLADVLAHAFQGVPFYADRRHVLPASITDQNAVDVLKTLPIIDKAIVKAAGEQMFGRVRGLRFDGSTSGTTGAPLTVRQDLSAISRENAFVHRQLHWAGYRPGDRKAWIRGDMVVPADCVRPPYWRRNRFENMVVFSSYHLAEHAAPAYVAALTQFDPHLIQAYPSSIGFLARYMAAQGIQYSGKALRAIVTSSETLEPSLRAVIERSFRCRVFDWYGQTERVAAIGTCEHGSYHIISDYSFVELVPTAPGFAEIVGTGFNNLLMPLIRYRTGDTVLLGDQSHECACGRKFPIISQVIGRSDDVVKLPDGRRVGRLDHIFKGIDAVIEAQIRQDAVDRIDILVVCEKEHQAIVRRSILKNAGVRLGQDIVIRVVFVPHIERAANGKLKGVICSV